MLLYKTTVAVVAGLLGVALVLLLVWCRLGLVISLYCRREIAPTGIEILHGSGLRQWSVF